MPLTQFPRITASSFLTALTHFACFQIFYKWNHTLCLFCVILCSVLSLWAPFRLLGVVVGHSDCCIVSHVWLFQNLVMQCDYRWALWLFSSFSLFRQWCCELSYTCLWWTEGHISVGLIPRRWIAESEDLNKSALVDIAQQ